MVGKRRGGYTYVRYAPKAAGYYEWTNARTEAAFVTLPHFDK